MLYQVCKTKNGVLRHYYIGENHAWFSRIKATNFTLEEAREILRKHPDEDIFIQSQYDCHWRDTDKDGYIL